MAAILTTIIPLILKYIIPLIAAWFAQRGQVALAANPDATADQLYQLLGAWGAIGAASAGSGEAIAWKIRRDAVGAMDVEKLKRIIELILQLIAVLMPDKVKEIRSVVAAGLSTSEAASLGLRRE